MTVFIVQEQQRPSVKQLLNVCMSTDTNIAYREFLPELQGFQQHSEEDEEIMETETSLNSC